MQILIETVGKGGFGTVFRALHKEKGNFVAVKKIRLKNMVDKDQLDTLMVSKFPNTTHKIFRWRLRC
jgi:serine/threonine protein kinase